MWMGGAGNQFTRVDIKTAKVEATFAGRGYQVVVNSKGNPYIGGGPGIVGFDVEANEPKSWPLPNQETGRRFARRGKMDSEDRFWFAEYYGDKIGMFDTRTEEIKEWDLRKYSTPYSASAPDKEGHVWANSNMSDRLFRLNPDTGAIVEYLMPTEIDTKEMVSDPSTDRVVMLMTNMRGARVVRVEVLD
jgi:streptogramin lyase